MVIASTPEAIELYKLFTLKYRLKLEKWGMKSSSRRESAMSICKRTYAVKTRDYDKLIELVQNDIEEKSKNPAARFERI